MGPSSPATRHRVLRLRTAIREAERAARRRGAARVPCAGPWGLVAEPACKRCWIPDHKQVARDLRSRGR